MHVWTPVRDSTAPCREVIYKLADIFKGYPDVPVDLFGQLAVRSSFSSTDLLSMMQAARRSSLSK